MRGEILIYKKRPKATTSICPADDIHLQPSYIFVGLSLCRREVQFALKGCEDLPVCLWLFHPMLLLPQPVHRRTPIH